ncbi:hypothetical protein ACHAQA_006830 [Verticillium albo-atrum]
MSAISSQSNRDSFSSALNRMSEINIETTFSLESGREIRGAKGSSQEQSEARQNQWWKKARAKTKEEAKGQADKARRAYTMVKEKVKRQVQEWKQSLHAHIWSSIGPRDADSDVDVPLMQGIILETVMDSARMA